MDIKFDWDDILIIPSDVSEVRSRKEIDLTTLPLYVSPMDTVVDADNAHIFHELGFEVCLPRHINYCPELDYCFFSYGLSKMKGILDNSHPIIEDKVLIDIANGNMEELLDVIKKFKSTFPEKILMVGNVANPMTYKHLSDAGADIIRVGVGNGSGCHVSGTKVKTKSGYSNIEDLMVGDEVLTHLNTYEEITHVHILNSDNNLMIVNNNIATSDHEYYVVHKKYEEILTDDNVHESAEWIELQDLSDDYYLLELNDTEEKKYKLIKIQNLSKIDGNRTVYDITVNKNSSYTANDIIVHNCLTTQQTGIGYPMGSLIEECRELKVKYNLNSQILADGGFRKYADVIKSLAVGSDGVMLGGILNKSVESCSTNLIKGVGAYLPVSREDAVRFFDEGKTLYKYYRGMSTKEVQRDWGREKLQTSEGISKYNKVEYRLSGWVENFTDYLRTNMSYCGKFNLDEYIGKVRYIIVTPSSFARYNK